jgi:hypothetical protein
MPQYAATIRKLKEGVKGFTISAAVKNIEGWEEALGELDTPGVKGVAGDLRKLKRLIQADPIDGEAVKQVLQKLGEATLRVAERADDKKAARIREIGEALQQAG